MNIQPFPPNRIKCWCFSEVWGSPHLRNCRSPETRRMQDHPMNVSFMLPTCSNSRHHHPVFVTFIRSDPLTATQWLGAGHIFAGWLLPSLHRKLYRCAPGVASSSKLWHLGSSYLQNPFQTLNIFRRELMGNRMESQWEAWYKWIWPGQIGPSPKHRGIIPMFPTHF